MKQRSLTPLVLLLIATMTMATQCDKDYPYLPPEHQYLQELHLSPYKKTYVLGDTIWVELQTTDKTLFDEKSGNKIPNDTTVLAVQINLFKRYLYDTGTDLFSGVKVEGGVNVNYAPSPVSYNILNFNTDCSNSNYSFRVGFVPQKTGIYSIEPYARVTGCPTKVKWPNDEFRFKFDVDCNKDVWLSIPEQSRGGETASTGAQIDNRQIFVFEVK